MQFSKMNTAVVALALITIGLVGFAAIGAAQSDELTEVDNSTIETTNETEYIELDIEFAETFENTSTETVELTIYNETEFESDGENATAVLTDSVTGEPSDTVTNKYNLSDTSLESETEYRAIVEVGNENNIASGYVAVDDESVGGATFGSDADGLPGFGVGVAITALATALVARAYSGGE